MPALSYRGLDARGKAVSGVRDAENPRGLRALLRKDGVFVTDVFEAGETPASAGKGLRREVDFKAMFDRVKPQDVAILTRQLGTLLHAGIPLVEALTALMEQATSAKLGAAVADVRTKVNEGVALGDALAEHPAYFSDLYVNMVRAGETAGNLEQVLLRLAVFLDSQQELRGKVGSAMAYPLVIMVVCAAVMTLLMAVVVPQITQIFADMGEALPWYTQVLIGVSSLVAGYWWAIALLTGTGIYAFRRWKRTEKGTARWDAFVLRVWLVGAVVRMVAISRFARTLGTMLQSGVPLLHSLEIVKAILGNKVLVDVVDKARIAIREGDSIADPLARSGHFPPMVTRMIAVGERSGALESMLETVADAYEKDVEIKLNSLTAVLGPLMIVMMAVGVGFIVFSILMPFLQLNEMIG